MDAAFLLAMLVVLTATMVAGLAGFGLAIVSVPPLLLLYDPGTVIALLKILTLGTTWIILVDAWRHISWRWIVRLFPTALIGLFIGSWLLRVLNADVIKAVAGIVVVSLAVLLLAWRPYKITERPWMAPVIGLASGASSTSTGLTGPPVVLFFTAMSVPTQVFRATVAMYFTGLDLVGLPTLILQGTITSDDLRLALALAPVAIIGRALGVRLVRYVSPVAFRRATLALLLVTGTASIVTGLSRYL